MPKVGDKRFPYTAKGKAAAKRQSRRTGKPVKNAKPKRRYDTSTNTFVRATEY